MWEKVFTSFDNISLDFNTKVWDPHWKLLCMTIECENQTKPDIQIFSCWGKTFSLAFPILHVIHAAKTANSGHFHWSFMFIKVH